MNPARDALYRVHQCQAARRGRPALPYEQFRARLPATYETDLSGLFLPPAGQSIRIKVTSAPKLTLGRVCITPTAANAVSADELLQAIARHATGDWGCWTNTTGRKTSVL